jgi:hypothetical protein
MIKFLVCGIIVLFTGWISFGSWMYSGDRQAIKCRKKYLNVLMKQSI